MPFICHGELMLCIRSPWIGHLHLYRCFPMTLFCRDLGDPVWGALSAASFKLLSPRLLPRPHFKRPPLPFLLLLLLLSCSGHSLSSSGPLLSNNVCIHAPMETQIHRNTVTPTQTHFVGFPRVKLWSISASRSSPITNMIVAQPVGSLPSRSPRVYVSTYRHSSAMGWGQVGAADGW